MTKQEKIASWMGGLGFKLDSETQIWHHTERPLDLFAPEATFFYDVTNAARLDEIGKMAQWINDSPFAYPELVGGFANNYMNERLRHLKQEGKTNG